MGIPWVVLYLQFKQIYPAGVKQMAGLTLNFVRIPPPG